MADTVVALNAGSSSIKFALFEASSHLLPIGRGQIENIGRDPRLELDFADPGIVGGAALPEGASDHAGIIEFVLNEIVAPSSGLCIGVGHRIVHGGSKFNEPTRVDEAVLNELDGLIPLARAHQPHNLAGVRAALSVWPGVPQLACFDTAFHQTIPARHHTYAIPGWMREEGVRQYGFHGLSYEAAKIGIAEAVPHLAEARVVIAHLGNGASLCGMRNGESCYTSMGFTPLDGLVMGRRPGRLDPGVLLYLAREKQFDTEAISVLLNRDCGLVGLSGKSSDMRDVLADSAPQSRLAVDVFIARLVCEIGAAVAAIGGLDALVFTGGIGQNSAEIRARVASELNWLNVVMDTEANEAGQTIVSRPDSGVCLLMLPADEERIIASHTCTYLGIAPS